MRQHGYKTPDHLEEIAPRIVDAIIYGKDDRVGDTSAYERLTSYNLLPPPEEETEDDAKESNKEAERLANWKANFPYQPIPIQTW